MEHFDLHPWNLTPSEAIRLQKELRDRVQIHPYPGLPQTIAGADISFNRGSRTVYAAFVVLEMASLEIVARSHAVVHVDFPYVPGLLSFREIPPLLRAWENLEVEPDVVVLDGQGIAHPRRLGIASHIGLLIDRPTIGCGKSLLVGKYENLGLEAGSSAPLMDRGENVGIALRTKNKTQPVFISPGHHMDIPSSQRIMLASVKRHRLPEPTRQAHIFVNELRQSGVGAPAKTCKI